MPYQTGFALHQMKRGDKFRKLIKAPDGHDLLEFDFAGQEYRWMACESEDPVMLKLCAPGEDAHAFMGGKVASITYEDMLAGGLTGDPVIKNARYIGKVGNLSLQYRTSAGTLRSVAKASYGINLSGMEANALWGNYRTTYILVPQYWKRQIYAAKRDGFVETKAGRRVQLGTGDTWGPKRLWSADGVQAPDDPDNLDTHWARESTAINFPIQGAGADQKYLALAIARDYLPRCDGKFYFEMHDGLFFVVPHAKAEKAAHELKHLLSNLPYRKAWGYNPPIQFPVDGKRGPSWGELEVVQ